MSNRKSVIYTSRSTLVGSNNRNDEKLEYARKQTSELEKVEQEITLTLQEIDRNLDKTNKIINESLIPVIKSYSKSSKKLWEGSKFWKNFFEDSANIQIGGVEDMVDKYRLEEEQELKADDVGGSTEGHSIIARYYNQVNGDQQSSTLIKSTPKQQKKYESSQLQPPSSPVISNTNKELTTSSIFNNINKEEEINFHQAYKIKLTPNKRLKKGIFEDSPDLAPPRLTAFSPLKPTDDSTQLTGSPPRTIAFARNVDPINKTPSRMIAQNKTNDLKDIVGANDSSLQQPPQFTLPNNVQPLQRHDDSSNIPPPTVGKQFELDAILDNKIEQFNKTNNIDWSDEEV